MKIDPEREITNREFMNLPTANNFDDYPIGSLVTLRHDEVKLDYPNLDMPHTLLNQSLWSAADRWNPDPRVDSLIVLTAQTDLDERIDSIEPIHKEGVAAVAYSNTGAFVCDITPEELDRLYWATEETLAELKEFALQYKKWIPVTFLNQKWAGITVALPEIIGKSQTYDPHLREHLYEDGYIVIQITEKGPLHKHLKGLETFAALPSFLSSQFPEIEIKRSARRELTTETSGYVKSEPYLIAEGEPEEIGPRGDDDPLPKEWPAVYVEVTERHGYEDHDCTLYQFIPLERHTRNANNEESESFTSLVILRSVFKDESNSTLDTLINFYRGSEIVKEVSMEIVEVADGSWDSYRYQWLIWLDGYFALQNGFDFILDDEHKVVSKPDLSTFG
jgi:hypothetical protein